MDIKIICYKDNSRKNQIVKAINILNSIQNYFFYRIINVDDDVCTTETVDWDSFCERIGKRLMNTQYT